MSSKADDFDVRYRGTGSDHPRANGGFGGNGTVDYDLGYDGQDWDTQGFLRPTDVNGSAPRQAGSGVGTAVRPSRGRSGSRSGSHAKASVLGSGPALGAGPVLGSGPGGPIGPSGPSGFSGPSGPGGRPPRRRRGRERTQVKLKGSWWRRWTIRKALGVLLSIIGSFIVLTAGLVVVAYEKTPVPTEAMAAASFSQSVVYSANGSLVGRFGTTNRKPLSYSDLQNSKYLIPAVLAAEDRNFFNEGGVSPTGIVRAAYEDVQGGNSLQGGSTITQEFVRHYYEGIGTQQTLSRKIKEIFVAMKVSKEKSKQWILENYLNTIYMGQGAYGIGAAAETYFNEPVSKLTAAQAAVIAAIIQQPSTYPLPQYRANLEARWQYVLNGMVQMGTLTREQVATMKFPKIGDYVAQTVGNDVWDPYILDVVYNELVGVYHFSQSQIYNGGYVIRTTIDDAKMAALYKAVQQNEALMTQGGVSLPSYAHVGAVLENAKTGAIEAMYPGPGYPGTRYVTQTGQTRTMTPGQCKVLDCEVNMAVYNREQVGSSFKPYVLSTAVAQGMNVQTSTLNGFNPLWIPPDGDGVQYSANSQAQAGYQWYKVTNDSVSENGPFNVQMSMAESINTAYADLWHKVGGAAVAKMAQLFGVNTAAAGITGSGGMEHEAGVALGQASLTVSEQATMLATIADGGIYHSAHVISSIMQPQTNVQTPINVTSYPVFDSANATLNSEEASQVQYAMSADTAPYGTAPSAAMSNGQQIIAKTGTTNHFQSAFFIGALPTDSLAVGIFTNKSVQSLPSDLGGNGQGGYGGTWPAAIWHTFAENVFVPMGVQTWGQPTFTGAAWNQVPQNLRKAPAKKKQPKKHDKNDNNDNNGFNFPGGPVNPNPNPYPTYSCDPSVVTCTPDNGNGNGHGGHGQSVSAVPAAVGGAIGLPVAGLLLRRRRRSLAARDPRGTVR